jgi:hypothetical protein
LLLGHGKYIWRSISVVTCGLVVQCCYTISVFSLLVSGNIMGFIERNKAALNDVVSASFVGRYFHLDGSGHVRRP